MKKKDAPASELESTSTQPIESTTTNEPEKKTENEVVISKVETISTPPIGEVKAAEKTLSTVEIISAPPITGEQPQVKQPDPIFPPTPAPATPAEPAPRGNRSFQDWLGADWSKSNADLARAHGVTRQAVAQMRKKVEQHNAGETPTFSDVAKVEAQPAEMVSKVVDYDVMSAMLFDMSAGLLITTFGPEWQPREAAEPGKPGERDMVCGALKIYLQSKNAQDIPPGLMLSAVLVAYAGPRLRVPNTANKLSMAWTWFKLKLAKFRKKKA